MAKVLFFEKISKYSLLKSQEFIFFGHHYQIFRQTKFDKCPYPKSSYKQGFQANIHQRVKGKIPKEKAFYRYQTKESGL